MTRLLSRAGLALLGAALLTPALFAGDGDDEAKTKAKAKPFDAASAEKVDALFAKSMEVAREGTCPIAPVAECTCTEGSDSAECTYEAGPGALLAKAIGYSPEAFHHIAPQLKEHFLARGTSADERRAILNVTIESWNPMAAKIATILHGERPSAFEEGHLISFSEMGCESTREALAKTVSKGKAGVLGAAYLAFQGDDAGRKTLLRAVKAAKSKALTAEQAAESLLAARALDQLGEAKALGFVQQRVHQQTLTALDEGRLEDARALAVSAEYCRRSARDGKLGLAFFENQRQQFCQKVAAKYETADAVFALIETTTPVVF